MIDAADRAAWNLFDEHLNYRDDEHRELLDAVAAALRRRDARIAELEYDRQRLDSIVAICRGAENTYLAAEMPSPRERHQSELVRKLLRVAIDALEDTT